MGLFVKKINEQSISYQINSTKTIAIVGLGNIGKQYELTRHNVGFMCLDTLQAARSEFEQWQDKKTFFGHISNGSFDKTKVTLLKPNTYMNESGKSVRAIMDFYKISPQDIIVVHDELDLPFGQIRTRMGGGSAGHNGIRSITAHIGEDFGRIRIGIQQDKPEQMTGADFVLGRFSSQEQTELPRLKREVENLLTEIIYRGYLTAETRSFLV